MRIDLLAADGAYDRAAIMRDAHRQFRLMARHGWTWSRCLAFSWAKARAMRAHMTADRGKVERLLVRPNVESVAAMFTAIAGRAPTLAELARVQAKFAERLASLEN